MATKIVTKNSSTASAVPTASDLVQGELAVNVADKRLFTEDNGGAIVELGTNPSGNVTFQDNGKAIFGAGSDLQIYHDGGTSVIADVGTGFLALRGDGNVTLQNAAGTENKLVASSDGAVTIYYDNSAKLATTSTGIDVTGNITVGTNDTTIAENNIRFKPTGAAYIDHNTVGQAINFRLSNASSLDKTAMTLTSAGNVGIGTTSPTSRLQIDGAEDRTGGLTLSAGGQNHTYFLSSDFVNVHNIETSSGSAAHTWQTNGSERMRINGSGNVGIGTSSPATNLHIQSASEPAITLFHTGIMASQIGLDSTGSLTFGIDGSTGATERMRIDASGNLLIGKTTTGVSGAGTVIRAGGELFVTRAGDVMNLNRLTSDGEIAVFRKDGTAVGSIGSALGDSSVSTLFIADAGNVGIRFDQASTDDIQPCTSTGADRDNTINLGATDNRFKDLYLSGNISAGTGGANANNYQIKVSAGTTGLSRFIAADTSDAGYIDYEHSSDSWIHRTAGAERMRIDSSGNLLVGTTSAVGTVTIGGAQTPAQPALYMQTYPTGHPTAYIYRNNTDAQYCLKLRHDGPVSGSGNGYMVLFTDRNDSTVGSITVSGSTTAYNTSSDARLKENIADAPSASDDIDAIQVRSFDWKVDGLHQKYGMVAQELQAVAPEAVSGDADSEEMMGVDYSKLVPMLIKEIQSLRNRVAQLEE